MTTETKKRPDILQVIVKSDRNISGKSDIRKIAGLVTLNVTKSFNMPSNSITIENSYRYHNGQREPRETALINIEFSDHSVWSGDFNKLQALVKHTEMALDLIIRIESVLIEQLDDDYKENADIIAIQQQSQDLLNDCGRVSAFDQP